MFDIKEINETVLKALSEKENPKLGFTKPISVDVLKPINQLLSKQKDITIRLWGSNKEWRDLSCLKELTNLEKLIIQNSYMTDISPIAHLQNLRELRLACGYREKPASLKHISNLKKLTSLGVSGVYSDYNESLKYCLNLKSLSISIEQLDLGFFKKTDWLEELQISRCTVKNLEQITYLKKLKSLTLTKIEGYDSLDFISNNKALESLTLTNIEGYGNLDFLSNNKALKSLTLYDLKKLKKVPNISGLKKLKKLIISLPNPTWLVDVSAIYDLNALEYLDLSIRKKVEFEAIKPIYDLSNLSYFALGTNNLLLREKHKSYCIEKRIENPYTDRDGNSKF